MCLVRTGKLSEALKRLSIALKLGLRSPVLFEAIGDAYFYAGRYEQAREAYEQTIAVGGISPLNNAKLGASEVCLGLAGQGLRRMKQAVDTSPEYVELYDILIAGALLAGDKTLAEQTAEAKISAAKSDHCAPVRHPAP
jgi:tetratricopeptide (TPR) repeat protein